MRSAKTIVFTLVAAFFGVAAAFFAYYGVLLVYAAVTFQGEGSLGHVGMYIAAGLFPFLAFVCGALAFLAWRTARRGSGELPPTS